MHIVGSGLMDIKAEGLNMVMEAIKEAVIGIDANANINIVNNAAKKLLGIDGENLHGRPIFELIPNSKLGDILKTGEKETGMDLKLNKRHFIADRFPVFENGNLCGAFAIFRDVTEYDSIKEQLDEERIYVDILNTILDTFNERYVVVDKNANITMMSKSYREFVGDEHPEGKHVCDVIENTRMHEVLRSGEMEIADIQEVQGNKMIAMRIPIIKNGDTIGVIGKVMFKDVEDLVSLSNKISKLEKEVEYYKNELSIESSARYSFDNIIGDSSSMKQVKRISKKVARTDSNVLITGESGTGKELFAHSIHNASPRSQGPFIKINCAAIPAELLESELFGYEDGAFTGAKKAGKKGKFELADGGTILLDEIGDMPLSMQVKLLRVLQEKEVERLGGTGTKKVDVRIIASTNKDLEGMVNEMKFREDLYYRLNVMTIKLPPLRERKADVEKLANELRKNVSKRLGVYAEGISADALKILKEYNWPGNIRELENVIERAINLLDADLMIRSTHLPQRILESKSRSHYRENSSLREIVGEIEKDVIFQCLQKNSWNKNKSAKLLGISRLGLYKKIEKYGLHEDIK